MSKPPQTPKCEVCHAPAEHIRRNAADICHRCYLTERRQIYAQKQHALKVEKGRGK